MEQTSPTTTTTTLSRPGQKQKLRLACDACLNAKVRCDKQHPSCQRCALSRRPCIYSPSRKSGRPAAARKRNMLPEQRANAAATPAAISPRQTSPDRKSDPAHMTTTTQQPLPQPNNASSASSFNTVNASTLGSNANSKPPSTTTPSSDSSSSGHDSGIFLMEEWLDFNTSSSSQDFDSSQQEHHNLSGNLIPQNQDASCSWLDVGKALDSPHADHFSPTLDPSTVSPTFVGSGSPYSNSTGTEGLTSHVDLGSEMFSSNHLASHLGGSHFDPMEGIQSPPISDQNQRHDCDQQVFGILASLQMLHQQQLGSFSLDKVLDTNRTAINKLIELLDCSCALEPHLALEYAAIVPRILHWYKTAAKHLQPSNPAVAGSSATSPASIDARQCPVLPQLGPISMSLGSFTLDESEQLDLTRRLVLSEVKKVEKIIAKMARVSVNGSMTMANKEEPIVLEASAPSRYAFACVTLRAELQQTIKQVGKGRKDIALME